MIRTRMTIAAVVIAVVAMVMVWFPMSRMTVGFFLLLVGLVLGLLFGSYLWRR